MIARTYDTDFIVRCVAEPGVWRMVADDGFPNPDLYFPPMGDGMYWLRAGDFGVFLFHPHNSVTYEAHTVLLPSARGKAVEIGKAAISWFFANTPCQCLITNVPEYNPLALRLAHKCGFATIGINEKSIMKNGILHDQTLLGISKERWTICQQ